MAEVKVFNGSGQASGSLQASEKLVSSNTSIGTIHQVMVAELAGKRQGTAKTKNRSEVSGSTVKIRRQKGTGRSRQGDKRTPHMRGGGVSHGPRPRDYHENTPRKMRQAAFRTALNSRLQNDLISILDGFTVEAPRTKAIVALLNAMGLGDKKVLLIAGQDEANVFLSARNLPKVTAATVAQTSLVDVLKCENIVCTRSAWDEMTLRIEGRASEGRTEEVAA